MATKQEILHLLDTRADAVERALQVLYGFQTAGEQSADATVEANGQGFNMMDAPFLSDLARQVIRSSRPRGQRLSPKQLAVARKRVRKYAGQLAANSRPTVAA